MIAKSKQKNILNCKCGNFPPAELAVRFSSIAIGLNPSAQDVNLCIGIPILEWNLFKSTFIFINLN